MSTDNSDIETLFVDRGAKFALSINKFANTLNRIRAFILDWDGVFNAGEKGDDQGSPFSEIDSMGLNMLRFAFYLKFDFIPAVFIITGENNQLALQLSKREHFNGVYFKINDKIKALAHVERNFGYTKEETGFVFDDILDLSVAEQVAIRYLIKRDSNPLLNQYIVNNKLADYYSAQQGGSNAVREICELNIGLLGNFEKVVDQRTAYSEIYKEYLSKRNDIVTGYYTLKNDTITEYLNP